MARDLAREMYRAFRSSPKRLRKIEDENRTKIDDPKLVSDVLDELIAKRDWVRGLAEGNIFTNWHLIVGNEIANHAEPVTIFEGALTIRAESTAWATQLNLVSPKLLEQIRSSAPGALVERLEIIGPHAPSWKRGLRTISNGRGPRDTYGQALLRPKPLTHPQNSAVKP